MKNLPAWRRSSLILLGLTLLGCGSDSGGGSAAGADAGPGGDEPLPPPPKGDDYLFPETAHTGFDGSHEFKVPLSTGFTGTVTWDVADPSIVDVAPAMAPPEYADYGESWALATSKKAGTTQVTAISGDKRVSATIVVTAYDATDVAAGETRYNMPENPTGEQRNACVSCHGLANGVDHSPLQMSFYADDEILAAITTGMYPDGYVLTGVNHAWNVSAAEKQGIVPYLRSLPPKGF
jgi:hypothetical protein